MTHREDPMSKPEDRAPDEGVTRRTMLDVALAAAGGAVGVAAVVPAARFATPPLDGAMHGERSSVGRVEDFTAGAARVLTVGTDAVIVVALPGGDLRAFEARCTHLGCVVQYNAHREQLECPCHGGRYALDGHVVAGPPPSGLREVPIEIRDGHVTLVRS